MDFFFPFFPLISTFCIIVLTVTVMIRRLSRPKNPMPPSPWKLPILGNIHHLIGAGPLHRVLGKLSRQCGPIMNLKLGQVDHIVFSSPEAAREILKIHDTNFASRPQLTAPTIITHNRNIAFAPYGNYLRQMRRICFLELFGPLPVKSFHAIRERGNATVLASVFSAADSSSPVNLSEQLLLMTNNNIARAVFGPESKHGHRFLAELKLASDLGVGFHLPDLYPSLGFVSRLLGQTAKLESARRYLYDQLLGGIITAHQLSSKNSVHDGKEEKDHLLDVLLRLKDQGGLNFPLAMDDIKSVLLDLFVAGTDTTAAIQIWAMTEMMRRPEVMKKAQEEVRQIAKGKGRVDEDDVDHLRYLKLVIKETLRLHPTTPLLLPRICGETCKVGGFEIPAGSRVLVNVWAINRDPRYWEDADSFRPERFEGSDVDFRGESFHYLPFGGGRRICPGMVFGLASVGITLAQLLFHFDWQLPSGMEPDQVSFEELVGSSVARKEPLCLIPTLRFPLLAAATTN